MKTLVVALAVALAAPVASAQCTDVYEPNDSCAQAPLLDANGSYAFTLETLQSSSGGNPDHFRAVVPAAETLRIVVSSFPLSEVFTLEVYGDAACSQVVASGLVPGVVEVVNTSPAPREYAFAVLPHPGAGFLLPCESLGMNLSTYFDVCSTLSPDALEPNDSLQTPAQVAPGTYVGLNVVGPDMDVYEVPVPQGWALVVGMDATVGIGTPPSPTFFDAGTLQALQGGSPDGSTLFLNTTSSPTVLVGLGPVAPDSCGVYDITFTVADPDCGVPPDALEENDSCNGLLLAPGAYPGLGVSLGDADVYRVPAPPQGEVVVVAVERDPSSGSGLRAEAFEACSALHPYPLHEFPGRSLLVLTGVDPGLAYSALRAEVDLEQLDPQAPCATYDLSMRGYAQPIGASYCPAVPHSGGKPARLEAFGFTDVATGDLVLSMTDGPPSSFGVIFYGPNVVQIPFGNGVRCVGGGLMRLGGTGATGAYGHLLRVLDLDQGPWTADLVPGSTWHFQAWFRDGASSNLSSAVTLTFH